MTKIIFATWLFLLFPTLSVLAAPLEYSTTMEDQQGVSVTIYNSNLALVKDQRSLVVPTGEHVLAFREVSAMIKPETALLSGSSLAILEQNFEFDLLTPQALLEKYVGKEVSVVKTHPTTGVESREKGTILSGKNGVVLQMADHIETGVPGRLIFDAVPGALRDRPTLTMLVRSSTEGRQDVELSYLTAGLGWQADYVAELNATDDALDLSGWVTLTNQSGATYRNAVLQLVAGDVHQATPEPSYRRGYRLEKMAMVAEDSMAEEQIFEYHLYSLERPTTIKDNQTKQVSLLQAGQVSCRKEFVLQGNNYYYQGQYGEIGGKEKVGVYVELENNKANNLGIPLPKGVVRVYKKDSQGRLQFVGEDRIDHTPENESVRLKLGDAFDVTAKRKQTDFKKLPGFSRHNTAFETAYQITLKNGKKEAVVVKVVEPISGDWEMMEESLPHKKATASKAVWLVDIPAMGETTLSYRVTVNY